MSEEETDVTVISVRVPPALIEKLDRLAIMGHTTRSVVVRMLIENATPADLIPASLKGAAETDTEAAQ